jgi:hypothetical protein
MSTARSPTSTMNGTRDITDLESLVMIAPAKKNKQYLYKDKKIISLTQYME